MFPKYTICSDTLTPEFLLLQGSAEQVGVAIRYGVLSWSALYVNLNIPMRWMQRRDCDDTTYLSWPFEHCFPTYLIRDSCWSVICHDYYCTEPFVPPFMSMVGQKASHIEYLDQTPAQLFLPMTLPYDRSVPLRVDPYVRGIVVEDAILDHQHDAQWIKANAETIAENVIYIPIYGCRNTSWTENKHIGGENESRNMSFVPYDCTNIWQLFRLDVSVRHGVLRAYTNDIVDYCYPSHIRPLSGYHLRIIILQDTHLADTCRQGCLLSKLRAMPFVHYTLMTHREWIPLSDAWPEIQETYAAYLLSWWYLRKRGLPIELLRCIVQY